MPKNLHVDNSIPVDRSSYSSGTRGESATARNLSGNHHGNRARAQRGRGVKSTRTPKSY